MVETAAGPGWSGAAVGVGVRIGTLVGAGRSIAATGQTGLCKIPINSPKATTSKIKNDTSSNCLFFISLPPFPWKRFPLKAGLPFEESGYMPSEHAVDRALSTSNRIVEPPGVQPLLAIFHPPADRPDFPAFGNLPTPRPKSARSPGFYRSTLRRCAG